MKCFVFLFIILIVSCSPPSIDARKELVKLNLDYNNEKFVDVCKKEDITAIKLYLVAGMDANVRDSSGASCLAAALESGNLDMLEILISNNVDVNGYLFSSVPPLSYAVTKEKNDVRIIKKLLSAGARTDVMFKGAVALSEASAKNNPNKEIIKLLIEKTDLKKIINSQPHLLGNLVRENMDNGLWNDEIIKLNNAGFDHTFSAGEGKRNPFETSATKKFRKKIFKHFVSKTKDINKKSSGLGETILSFVVKGALSEKEKIEGVVILLDAGADVDVENDEGYTSYEIAQIDGSEELIKILKNKSPKRFLDENELNVARLSRKMLNLEIKMSKSWHLSAFINNSVSWDTFPEADKLLKESGLAGNQLLDISGNGRALLVTNDSHFSTTGNISLWTKELGKIETPLGFIPIFVEFKDYAKLKEEYLKLNNEYNNIAIDILHSKIKDNVKSYGDIDQAVFNFLNKEEKLTGLHGGIVWVKMKTVFTCKSIINNTLSYEKWDKLLSGFVSNSTPKIPGNPLTDFTFCHRDKHKNSEYEFARCMCGEDSDEINKISRVNVEYFNFVFSNLSKKVLSNRTSEVEKH